MVLFDGFTFVVLFCRTNLQDINGSMYRKVNGEVETGAFFTYSKEEGNKFGMAAKYWPHEDTAFTVRIISLFSFKTMV